MKSLNAITVFSGNTPGQGKFQLFQTDDGFGIFVVFPEGEFYERYELTKEEAFDELRSLGIIN